MRIAVSTFLLAAFAAAFPTASWSQNLVVNGDFGINGGDASVNSAEAWLGSGEEGAYYSCTASGNCLGFTGSAGAPAGTSAYAAFTVGNGGGAKQNVTLAVSGSYQFSFYYIASGGNPGGSDPDLNVTLGGQTVFDGADTATSWTLFTDTLTLAAGLTAIDFTGTWNFGAEGAIGGVSLLYLTNIINSGETLTGVDTVGTTIVNSGGTFAPGNGTPGTSQTIDGNLTMMPGSIFAIYLNPTTSTFANVTGTASLDGNVQANFANGSYISKSYTILTSTGGVSGTFSGVTNINLPTNFHDSLSYDAKNAYLDLTLNFVPPPPPPSGGQQPPSAPIYNVLTVNQQNIANTLVNSFNTNGGIPTKFGALPGAALSQVDGEGNTGAEHAAFQLESEFLNTMLDPFVDGRGGDSPNTSSGSAQPLGYTGQQFMPRAMADAYGMVLKGPLPAVYHHIGRPGGPPMAGSATPTAMRRRVRTSLRPTRSALPAAWIIMSRATRSSASRSAAAAPIGTSPRSAAAATAPPCRRASMASLIPGRCMAPRPSGSPTIGSIPIARHWAINCRQTSAARATAAGLRAAIISTRCRSA